MRCTTLAAITPFLALSLLGSACGDSRTPSGPGTPTNKDAANTSGQPDAAVSSGNPDAANTGGDPDAAAMGMPDAPPVGNLDATACACDLNPNACDQGCACDSRCGMGNPDATVMGNPDAAPIAFDGGGPLMGDPFNPQQLSATYAASICGFREVCEPVFATYLPQTRQQCETEVAAQVLANFTAQQPLIMAGRIAYNQANFTRCQNAYTAALQNCAAGPDPLACDDIFVGNRPEGAACGSSTECVNTWCAIQDFNQCAACTAFAQVGEDCAQNFCAPGTDCVQVDQQGTVLCVPVTANVGEECLTVQTGLCRGRLQCVGPMAGPFSCVVPAAANAACDDTGVAADCNIYQNQVCGPNNTCVPLNHVGMGAGCGMNNPTNLCGSTFRCDTAAAACVALPGAGGMCNADVPCLVGNFCNPTTPGSDQGTCTAEFGAGTACMASAQCSGTNLCVGGACGPALFNAACN